MTRRGNKDTDQADVGPEVGRGSHLLVAHTSNEISLETCGLYLDVTGKVAYRHEGWHRATDSCPAGAGRIMAWRYAQGSMGTPEHGLW